MRTLSWLLAALLWTLAASAPAAAQATPSPAELSLARQEFVAGVEAARSGAWQQAFDRFQRSYALYPHAETLFNLAGAERRLGQLVAAAESYRAYLRHDETATAPDNRAYALKALDELAASVGHVVLRVAGVLSTDRVALDGVPLNRAALSAELPVDPGKHVVTVHRDGNEVLRREFWAEPGESLELTAYLPGAEPPDAPPEPLPAVSLPLAQRSPPDSYGPPEKRKRMRRIVIWASVGLAAVGGGVAAYFLTREDDPEEFEGTLGPNVTIR
jgi:hypothetical protein